MLGGEIPGSSGIPPAELQHISVTVVIVVATCFNDPSCFSGQFEDMHPGARAICNVNVTAIV